MDRAFWTYVFTSFQGRINREPFWIAFGILTAIEITAQWLAGQAEGDTLGTILDLAFTYPEFALAVKRANDRNLTPWVVALFFAFNVALDLFTLLNGPIDPTNPLIQFIGYPFGLLALILLIELGFRRGTSGSNRFGPDPLADGAPGILIQYAVVRRLVGWSQALVPGEPFILRDRGAPNFPADLPKSVRNWCFAITFVNAVIFVTASFILRSIQPALVFALITAVGPINFLLFWKRLIKHLNRGPLDANALRSMSGPGANLSIEWCAIFALLGTPLLMIIFIVTL
jgi:uncharacterized membrane protein YhaH (DUF805 family)